MGQSIAQLESPAAGGDEAPGLPADGRVPSEAEDLMREYIETGDPRLRERVILSYLSLAERLAAKFRKVPTSAREDLLQMARTGLVAALDRYDPRRGVPFVPYAITCVLGEIKRGLRDTTWRLHVTRRIQDRTLRLLPELDRLWDELNRSPTIEELAARMETTEEMILEAIEAANSRVVLSLDGPATNADQGSTPLGDMLAAEEPTEEREDLLMLPELVDHLPQIERSAVILYFFDELKQREIAARLGCSQMQVSRLLARALGRLRATLLTP